MLNLIDVITNNYFLKQKLKVTIPKTPVRRLTDSWQGSTKSGKKILDFLITGKNIYFLLQQLMKKIRLLTR